jgi:hypothetical protein
MGVGSKSDVRSVMSPITLAPATKNPWGNPMKSGIVSPAYNAADTVTYKYGPKADIGTDAAPSNYPWSDDDGTIGNAAGAHFGCFQQWDVTPGLKTISAFGLRGAFFQATHVTSYAVEIWREDATEYTRVATSGDIAAEVGSTGTMNLALTLTPFTVTLVAGKKYFFGIRFIRTAGNAATPQPGRTNGEAFAHTNMRFAVLAADWNGSTVSKTDSAGHNYVYTDDECALMHLVYTSGNYLEQDITTVAAGSYLLARPATANYVIQIESAVVADTKSLTAAFRDFARNGTGLTTKTLHLDCGETTGGTNTLSVDANLVTLGTIGGVTQAGKTFDLLVGVRPQPNTTSKYELFWQCRHLEAAIHAHAVTVAATRGSLYTYDTTYAQQRVITLTGTFTVSKIRVGTNPLVMISDSQAIQNTGTDLRGLNADRWGGLPAALTKPRICVLHGQSGQYVYDTNVNGVQQLIFRNATPGVGDGVELLGLGCTWFFAGIGINDVSAATTASDADVRQCVADLVRSYVSIASYIQDAGESIWLAGMPPYSSIVNADVYEGKVSRWINRALLGLALAWKCPFYNPWPDIVEPGTENSTTWTAQVHHPAMLDAYSDDQGTHYSAAGGAIVVANMKAAIENGTIDLRDAWD